MIPDHDHPHDPGGGGTRQFDHLALDLDDVAVHLLRDHRRRRCTGHFDGTDRESPGVRSGFDADREATEQQDQQGDSDHKRPHRMVKSALVLTVAHAVTLAEWLARAQPKPHVRTCTVVVANWSGLAALVCVPGRCGPSPPATCVGMMGTLCLSRGAR